MKEKASFFYIFYVKFFAPLFFKKADGVWGSALHIKRTGSGQSPATACGTEWVFPRRGNDKEKGRKLRDFC